MRRALKPMPSGFSLSEALLALGVLGLGTVGILALFTTGISTASQSGNTTTASMEAQSLLARILSEDDEPVAGTPARRRFLSRIAAGKEWIQREDGAEEPAELDAARQLSWACRASHVPLNLRQPLKGPAEYAEPLPPGLYQIAIAVYREYPQRKDPIAVFTTLVRAEP